MRLGLRPVRALRVHLSRKGGTVEADGRLVPPARVGRRKGCRGVVTLRVLGAKRTLHRRRARLKRDCLIALEVPVPRGAPTRLIATVGFGGNDRLLPRLVGPRPVRLEIPLAVPRD